MVIRRTASAPKCRPIQGFWDAVFDAWKNLVNPLPPLRTAKRDARLFPVSPLSCPVPVVNLVATAESRLSKLQLVAWPNLTLVALSADLLSAMGSPIRSPRS